MTDIFKGATDQSIFVELVDSTTGLPKTGVVYTSVTAAYVRTRSAKVDITPGSLASASAAHSDGGFILVNDTASPGVYRLDVPDLAFATGANEVVVTVVATGCRTVSRLFPLVDINNQVAYAPNVAAGGVGGLLTAPTTANTGLANVTQFGGTNLTAASGIPEVKVASMATNTLTAAAISADAGAELAALVETYIVNEGDATAVMQAIADKIAADWIAGDASPLAVATAVWAVATRTITGGSLTTSPPTAAVIADAVWDEARSGHVTAGTFGEKVNAELDSAVRVKLDATQPDYVPATATSLAAAKAILDKIDSGLVADGLVYQFTANMLELGPAGSGGSSDWTADERTAIRSILGIPGSGTTPANPTTGILDTIRDLVVAYIAAALATVDGSSGTIVDFPTSLNIGDSYTDEANASIHVFIRDASDDPITAVGSFNFTDPEFAPEVNITQSGSTGRVKAVVTFVEASPEDYLKVEIPSSQSRRASPGTATIQCLLKWVDTDGKVLCQKTLSKQAVTWNEMV